MDQPWRLFAAIGFVLTLAAGVAWSLTSQPRHRPAPPQPLAVAAPQTPSPSPAPSPSPPPPPSEDPRLAALRASDAYDELAEHERAMHAENSGFAWGNFRPYRGDERFEWTNKAELWDSIMPAIRDEALLLGPEHTEPLWGAREALPTAIEMRWSNEDTGGRGQFVEVHVTYTTDAGPVQRYWAFLVHLRADGGRGAVGAAMPPFELAVRDFPSLAAQRDVLRPRLWNWISSQSTR